MPTPSGGWLTFREAHIVLQVLERGLISTGALETSSQGYVSEDGKYVSGSTKTQERHDYGLTTVMQVGKYENQIVGPRFRPVSHGYLENRGPGGGRSLTSSRLRRPRTSSAAKPSPLRSPGPPLRGADVGVVAPRPPFRPDLPGLRDSHSPCTQPGLSASGSQAPMGLASRGR